MDVLGIEVVVQGISGESGAWLSFEGVVRPTEEGRAILGIRYSAYEGMAERVMREVVEEFAAHEGVQRVEVRHLLGFVAAGDVSLFLRVRGRRSVETFRQLEGCLAAVKVRVPIWKEFVWG